jgi:4-hydroxy-3-polyprenylbenzoate decarboxylase
MNRLKSLREYIDALTAIGESIEIKVPVDLNLEIGAICRRCYETGAPAPLFTNIPGAIQGSRVLGAPVGVSLQPGLYLARIAVSLGLEPKANAKEIIDAIASARDRKAVPPKLISAGPCKENIILGDKINLLELPAPLLHGGDGGRFLNTMGIIVAQTPDKKWTNWSIARIMLVDEKRMAGIVAPTQHIGMVRKTWSDIGKDMPFALAIGTEPFIPFVGGMPLPAYVNEADFVGAYFNEPVEVVQCETVDLQVPATSEIVVEGYLSQTETAPEGPMGEYAGYLWTTGPTPKPVYHATALTYRNNPILPVSVAGEPPEENHTVWGVPNAAEILWTLRKKDLPVFSVWSPFESANHLYAISLPYNWRTRFNGGSEHICRTIGEALFDTKAGIGTPKYLIVEQDVDVSNLKELFWAFMTRNYPGEKGEVVFHGESTNPLVAFLDSGEKTSMHTTKVIYNCLPPDEWAGRVPKRSSFKGVYPADLQARVLKNWREYGFR